MDDTQPSEAHPNGTTTIPIAAGATTSSETLGSKRQRRPSVRLGDIGGDHIHDADAAAAVASANPRRGNRQWKTHPHHQSQHLSNLDSHRSDGISKGSSRTRPITNLTTLGEEKEVNLDAMAIGSWKRSAVLPPPNAPVKRVRSNWVARDSKLDDGGGGNSNELERQGKYSGGEDMEEAEEEDGYSDRDFDRENSGSKEDNVKSPITSVENLGDGNERCDKGFYGNRRKVRSFNRYCNQSHHLDGVEHSGPSDNDVRCMGGGGGGEDGVRIWLNSIGLGRYAPVFEIHEVDDEVLPMLTLEDLKDMGINAVGSRRKMFCAIQKLGRGFS